MVMLLLLRLQRASNLQRGPPMLPRGRRAAGCADTEAVRGGTGEQVQDLWMWAPLTRRAQPPVSVTRPATRERCAPTCSYRNVLPSCHCSIGILRSRCERPAGDEGTSQALGLKVVPPRRPSYSPPLSPGAALGELRPGCAL
eukprot:scaffold11693_cov115-Isochrysis_galbana.AAC.14